MEEKEYENLKIKFLKSFANLPEKIRFEDIIAVIKDQPFSWNAAAIEIKNDSETGRKILNILKKLGIL